MRVSTVGLGAGFAIVAAAVAYGAPVAGSAPPPLRIAPTMAPAAGADAADRSDAAEQRMRRRFPQPVRVGDLVGLPVLDDGSRTLGLVREVVRTAGNKIELIVA